MKYKEFTKWYNQRLCEGLWSEKDAIYCTNILDMLRQLPFWTRKRVWLAEIKNTETFHKAALYQTTR